MRNHFIFVMLFFVLILIIFSQGSTNFKLNKQLLLNQAEHKDAEPSQSLNLNPDFGKIPLYFIPNEGQAEKNVLFYAKTSSYTLWLTKEGLVFDSTRRIKKESTESIIQNPRYKNSPEVVKYERDVSRLVFVNANRSPEAIPVENTEHKVNYFRGNDKSKWRTNIQTSGAVLFRELYPNINLKVYGFERQIEYDFVVKPGGDISDISFVYTGVKKTRIDAVGNLVVQTEFGQLAHAKPVSYQLIEGKKLKIKAEFKEMENNTYGFRCVEYNQNYDLIIDPVVLVYSTYLGGSNSDSTHGIAVDSQDAVYVTGTTLSGNFPAQNPIQGSFGGGSCDAFITKINSTGSGLIYSTYLGGYNRDVGIGIAVDSNGAVYVAGNTDSVNFPTKNPIQGSFGGGSWDVFIAKINSSGSALIYSTYLGGSDLDKLYQGTAVDSNGAVYITGFTDSSNFPTRNPIQGSFGGGLYDAFIAKIKPSGGSLIYSTFLGGSGSDSGLNLALDSECAVYITGSTDSSNFPTKNPIQGSFGGSYDAFISKINSSGSAFVYSTYLGGSDSEEGYDIAVDSQNSVYVTGPTRSVNFPIQNPIQGKIAGGSDAYITKINTSGNAFAYSTYLGGSESDWIENIAVDSEGAIYVTGDTNSRNFPTQNPIQQSYGGGEYDILISKINASGSALVYSTYLGGSGSDRGRGMAVDSESAGYVTGTTDSVNFPTKNPIQRNCAGEKDGFIVKLSGSSGKIRIVSWNILNYPGVNETSREEFFQKILQVLNPDILVVQEMETATAVKQFLNKVLNPKKPKLYKAAKFFNGPDTDSAIFYKKANFTIKAPNVIPTTYRDISEYNIRIKKGPGKGSSFKLYSVHFSEGLTAGDKKQREDEADTLRSYLNGLASDSLFMVCGTFNMLTSKEKAFKILTGDPTKTGGRLKDPLNKKGKWHDKKSNRYTHSESTRKVKLGRGESGGLDDRFDMILISYGLAGNGELTYKSDSYLVFGNDGNHLNKAINKPRNTLVAANLADALYQASDHLPVIIELIPKDKSSEKN